MQTKDIGIILLIGLLMAGLFSNVNYTDITQVIDANVSGDQGLITFIDGNFLGVQTGFDFNSDTNSLGVNNIRGDLNKDYGVKYCADGNIVVGYLVGYSC